MRNLPVRLNTAKLIRPSIGKGMLRLLDDWMDPLGGGRGLSKWDEFACQRLGPGGLIIRDVADRCYRSLRWRQRRPLNLEPTLLPAPVSHSRPRDVKLLAYFRQGHVREPVLMCDGSHRLGPNQIVEFLPIPHDCPGRHCNLR